MLSADRLFKLAGSCGDGRLPYLNRDGAFLGAAVPLLERDQSGDWRPRPQPVLERLLSMGYGEPVDLGGRMSRLAAVARALNKGDSSLAGIALVRMELPPLPDDERAQAMAKADRLGKYDPDEPRVPAGSPDGGRWTSGSNSNPAGLVELASTHVDETKAKKERFVDAHLAEAQKVADELHVPVENILGISAYESGWGSVAGNNYLGIYYPAPYAIGFRPAKDNSKVRIAIFASYADCLKSFVAKYGDMIRDIQDPELFAAILQDRGKFGINPNGTKVSDYPAKVAKTAAGLRSIISDRKT